jgi:hypothetical protein
MNCEKCRYWSELVARSIGCGPMEAFCLCETGSKKQKFTKETDTCESWKINSNGAIDDPSRSGYENE